MSPSMDSIINLSTLLSCDTAYYIIIVYHIVFTIEILLDPGVLARNNLLIIIRMVKSMEGIRLSWVFIKIE